MSRGLKYYINLPYKVELYFEPTDKTWVATHPELGRGSCYAVGATKEEALKLLEEEKRALMELAINEGNKIPKPEFEEELPSGQFVLRLPRSLHKKLKDEADKDNISLNQFTVSILSQYVGAKGLLNSLLETQKQTPAFLQSRWENLFPRLIYHKTWAFAQYSLPIDEFKVAEKKSKYDYIIMGDPNVGIKEKEETTLGWRNFPVTIP